jgi:hypothetical protein
LQSILMQVNCLLLAEKKTKLILPNMYKPRFCQN